MSLSLIHIFVDISPLADFCAEGTKEKVEEARAKIMDGSFNAVSYTHLVKFGCVERTLFSSFGHSWLRDLKAQYPDLRTGLLYTAEFDQRLIQQPIGRRHVRILPERALNLDVDRVDVPDHLEQLVQGDVYKRQDTP